MSSRHSWRWRCGQFRLSAGVPGRRLRYDCPVHQPLEQGSAVSLQVCTREHTVTYRFQLPYLAHISEWSPTAAGAAAARARRW